MNAKPDISELLKRKFEPISDWRPAGQTTRSGEAVKSFFQETLERLHEKYHQYPTTLNYGPMTETETVEQSCNDAPGRHCAARPLPPGFDPGKDVA